MKALRFLAFIFAAGFFLTSCATSSDFLSDLPSESATADTYSLYAELEEASSPLTGVIKEVDERGDAVHLGATPKGECFIFLKRATVQLDGNGYEYRIWVRTGQKVSCKVNISGLYDKNPGKWLYLETEAIPQALRQYSLPQKEDGVEVEVVTTEGN